MYNSKIFCFVHRSFNHVNIYILLTQRKSDAPVLPKKNPKLYLHIGFFFFLSSSSIPLDSPRCHPSIMSGITGPIYLKDLYSKCFANQDKKMSVSLSGVIHHKSRPYTVHLQENYCTIFILNTSIL